MAHDHDHDAHQGYYLEQLSTIAACGALGAVCVLMYANDLLFLLAPQFHRWVLYGGITLLVFTAVRAVALWQSVGKNASHEHKHTHDREHQHEHTHDHHHGDRDHDHGATKLSISTAVAEGENGHNHNHSHDHGHHHHDHGHDHAGHTHDHDHSWTPIKYAMLLLPIVLFFLGMPNQQWKVDARKLFLLAQGGSSAVEQITTREHLELFVMMFLSVFYEALPFIVLGAVIAGILEEFIPSTWIAKIVPKNRYLAIAMGALLGLLFPMCECGVIPVMRRLLLKGMPLSTCIAYMLAGPIINFVVVANTLVAFQGHTSNGKSIAWIVLALRIGLGFGVAFITSLFVDRLYRKHGNDLLTPQARPDASDKALPSRRGDPLLVRLGRIGETTLHDFVDIAVFLLLGALLAALSRMIFTQEDIGRLSTEFPALAILGMMGFAIILCLCSEADAFVAASFTTLHPAAKLAFLVLGPMLDFKLLMMYTRVFRPRLIRTIVIALLIQVFLVSMAVHYVWEAVSPFKPGVIAMGNANVERTADEGNTLNYTFDELYQAAYNPKSRDWLDKQMRAGRTVRVVGEYLPQTAQEFTLCRTKITCCQLDMTVLRVRMILEPPATLSEKTELTPGKCVSVKGVIRFVKVPNRDEFASILQVKSPNDIAEADGCQ